MNKILPQPNIHFRHTETGERIDTIWSPLKNGAYKNILPENFLCNAVIEGIDRTYHKPVIKDFYLIHKGMLWDEDKKQPYDPFFIPKQKITNLDDFLENVHNFFKQYDGKKLGVQLSGGLDSSIIIALLKFFKLPFYLVGLVNNRFEFRTERYIQNILTKWSVGSILIDYETCLPYSYLENIPPHQYPEEYCRTFGPDYIMAKKAKEVGIEVLFTGQGGDNVFGDEIPTNAYELKWMPHTYHDFWLQDIVYSPQGIELVPFYADITISELIFNLRRGHKEDIPKVWARKFFKDFIPRELSDYTYHSDFWGFVISGVQYVIPKLPQLFEQAYDLTQNKHFCFEKVKELMAIDLLDHKKVTYMQIEPLLGIAVWLECLVKSKII